MQISCARPSFLACSLYRIVLLYNSYTFLDLLLNLVSELTRRTERSVLKSIPTSDPCPDEFCNIFYHCFD